MAIGSIEMQGQYLRTTDFAQIKSSEDQHTTVTQNSITVEKDRQEERQQNRVNTKDRADNRPGSFDAKEKGKNEYNGDGGRNRPHEREEDGRVILKGAYKV
ncbi:MAG: hypothetical protein K6E33_05940 [Lachnospiraceae bacterium]|nr:hypothetical protein [Lachnospiraceae bacterium]